MNTVAQSCAGLCIVAPMSVLLKWSILNKKRACAHAKTKIGSIYVRGPPSKHLLRIIFAGSALKNLKIRAPRGPSTTQSVRSGYVLHPIGCVRYGERLTSLRCGKLWTHIISNFPHSTRSPLWQTHPQTSATFVSFLVKSAHNGRQRPPDAYWADMRDWPRHRRVVQCMHTARERVSI